MDKKAIIVKNLSKVYRLGQEERFDTMTEFISNTLKKPFKNFKQISGLSNFGLNKSTDLLSTNDSNTTNQSIFWALKNISFDVDVGDTLGVIGKNGAGKSTLLRAISKITRITEGSIEINGRVASLLEVGTGFHPDLTGRENIYLNGTILGLSKVEIEDKFEDIIKFSGIGKFLDTPVKRYSSGMRVRLAFSVAANLEPEVLLVDEVLAVGDLDFQEKAINRLSENYKNSRTVFFVSHQLSMVEKLCNKSILLEDGKLIMIGDTKDVLSKYLSSWKVSNTADLTKVKNRKGDQSLIINRIDLNPSNETIASGSPLRIDVHYESKLIDIKDKECFITISFKNNFTSPLFQLSSKWVGLNQRDWFQKGIITFNIPSLDLLGGIYYFDIKLGVNGVTSDEINHAITFNIDSYDIYGFGRIPHASRGNMLTKFSIKNTSKE